MEQEPFGHHLNDFARAGSRHRCLEHRLVLLRVEGLPDLGGDRGHAVLAEHRNQLAQGQFDPLDHATGGGALLLAGGAPGKRFALPNARIMIHQPSGGAQGQATDIEIQAAEIQRLRKLLNEILASHSGKSVDDILRDTERDRFMDAETAKKYGLIDEVLSKRTNEQR